MLDQNTDRSYWMIGAVLVVGTLVGAVNVAFPDIFNMVVEGFKSKIPVI